MSIIEKVKVLLDLDESADAKLEILLEQAEADALAYTKREDAVGMDGVLQKMLLFLWNRLGTEGLNSESYSGASYNYTSGYPDDILSLLDDFKEGVNGAGRLITY